MGWESDPLKGKVKDPWPSQSHFCASTYSSSCKYRLQASPGPGRQDLPGEVLPDFGYMTLCACVCLYLCTLVSVGSIACPYTNDMSLPVP